MVLTSHKVGTRHFDETPVTVTDPCYSKGTWCTLENIHVLPGEYDCVKWTAQKYWTDENGKRHGYSRVFRCAIYRNGYENMPVSSSTKEIGYIGVDAGLAGFFQNKPDYDDDQWTKLCDDISDKNALITDHGFFTESGYGDGGYPVNAYYDKDGNIVGLEINFY